MPKPIKREKQKFNQYIGIDPGKSGGIADLLLDNRLDEWEITTYLMPSSMLDYLSLLRRIVFHNAVAVIEKVTSSPQQGVTSAFTFGKGYGSLLMASYALDLRTKEERPLTWQRALRIPPRKKSRLVHRRGKEKAKRIGEESNTAFKERLRVKAQQMFPQLEIWKEPRSKGKQLAICDALLIAAYCYQLHTGKEI